MVIWCDARNSTRILSRDDFLKIKYKLRMYVFCDLYKLFPSTGSGNINLNYRIRV